MSQIIPANGTSITNAVENMDALTSKMVKKLTYFAEALRAPTDFVFANGAPEFSLQHTEEHDFTPSPQLPRP